MPKYKPSTTMAKHMVSNQSVGNNNVVQKTRPAHPRQDSAGLVAVVALVVHLPYHMPGDIFTSAPFSLFAS